MGISTNTETIGKPKTKVRGFSKCVIITSRALSGRSRVRWMQYRRFASGQQWQEWATYRAFVSAVERAGGIVLDVPGCAPIQVNSRTHARIGTLETDIERNQAGKLLGYMSSAVDLFSDGKIANRNVTEPFG
jgi:hypothetical protein